MAAVGNFQVSLIDADLLRYLRIRGLIDALHASPQTKNCIKHAIIYLYKKTILTTPLVQLPTLDFELNRIEMLLQNPNQGELAIKDTLVDIGTTIHKIKVYQEEISEFDINIFTNLTRWCIGADQETFRTIIEPIFIDVEPNQMSDVPFPNLREDYAAAPIGAESDPPAARAEPVAPAAAAAAPTRLQQLASQYRANVNTNPGGVVSNAVGNVVGNLSKTKVGQTIGQLGDYASSAGKLAWNGLSAWYNGNNKKGVKSKRQKNKKSKKSKQSKRHNKKSKKSKRNNKLKI